MSETLKMVLIFIGGSMAGCFIGILVLSLCRAAKQADEDMINK